MTYILGYSHEGINSIISDTRLTWRAMENNTRGDNVAMKTGLLFPGCMFGMAGNVAEGRDFIHDVKYSLTPKNTVLGFWHEFMDFASQRVFSKDEDAQFELLLSTRASGTPAFYILSSQYGLKECDKSWLSIGSGKSILDPLIEKDFEIKLRWIQEAAQDHPFKQEVSPYLLSLWLTELAQAYERQHLESHQVGGVFNFVFQTNVSEHTQKPALYVLCDLDIVRRRIYFWQYRVCYVHPWLVVVTLIPPGQMCANPDGFQDRVVLLDSMSLPPNSRGAWDGQAIYEDLKERLEDELGQQPYYFFCGFGYTDPRHRKGFIFHMTTEGDYVIGKDGIAPEIQQQIIEAAITASDNESTAPEIHIWMKQPQKEKQAYPSIDPSKIGSTNLVGSGMRAKLGTSFEHPFPGTLAFRWRIGNQSRKMMLIDLVGGVSKNRISVILNGNDSLMLRAYDSLSHEISIVSKPYSPSSVLVVTVVWSKWNIALWIQGMLIGRMKLSKVFDVPWITLLCGIDVAGELSADIGNQGYTVDGLTGLNLGKEVFSEGARLSDVAIWRTALPRRVIKDLAMTSEEEVERRIRESYKTASG